MMASQDRLTKVMSDYSHEVNTTIAKGAVGFGGAFAGMTINDIAGLIVACLTAIYMCFQIEAAWRKRKKRIADERKNDE